MFPVRVLENAHYPVFKIFYLLIYVYLSLHFLMV